MKSSNPIPVTILTGYLGAGKTTLLNRILSENHGQKIAVIENEYGEIGIDNDLVVHSEEEIFEMNNGCICCKVRGDLVRILERLLKKERQFDRVIIETTGLADPSPVAQTFFLDEDLAGRFLVDAIVTLVDSKHLGWHLDQGSPEASQQLAFADAIILNKTDLVNDVELEELKEKIRSINAIVPIHECQNAGVDLSKVIDIRGFDLQRAVELDPAFKNGGHHHHHHRHEHGVSSVGIELEGEIDVQRFQAWMQVLTMSQGESLYRYKGVLVASNSPQRFVFQGIHMLFEGRYDRPWREDETRVNRFVFIGKDLNREFLKSGFEMCLVGAKLEEAKS